MERNEEREETHHRKSHQLRLKPRIAKAQPKKMASHKGFAKIDGHRCPLRKHEKTRNARKQEVAELSPLAKIDVQRYTLEVKPSFQNNVQSRAVKK